MKQRIAVGMSGGVDSSVTAALLVEQGHDVTGVFIEAYNEPGCRTDQDKKDALKVAMQLGIPFQVLDVRKEYKEKVVKYFYEAYVRGATPNPDVVCNREVKFGIFYDWARSRGFEKVATGHYARVTNRETPESGEVGLSGVSRKEHFLQRAVDETKDQSYFLWQVAQDHLDDIIFPLGTMLKKDVRKKAQQYGFPNADKPDSMGVCMIGEINLREFLKQKLGEKPGDVAMDGKIVGTHDGLWFHTIGQRGGFEVNKSRLKQLGYHPEDMEPLYVVGKDVVHNTLIVGSRLDAMRDTFGVADYELRITAAAVNALLEQQKLFVRIRNLGELHRVRRFTIHDSRFTIETFKPLFGVAEGQAAVLYADDNPTSLAATQGHGEVVVGGGEISV